MSGRYSGIGNSSYRDLDWNKTPEDARPRPLESAERTLSRTEDRSGAQPTTRAPRDKYSKVPPLWPDKTRAQGCKAVLSGVYRHLKAFGYWARVQELARFLRATRATTMWYIAENVKLGLLETYNDRLDRSEPRLTDRGWAYLGRQPVVPRKSRHKRTNRYEKLKARVMRQVRQEFPQLMA